VVRVVDVLAPKTGRGSEMDWFRLVMIEFLIPVVWPLVVLFAILTFRRDVSDFAKRLVKAGPTGIEAAPPQQSAEEVSKSMDEFLIPLCDLRPVEPWQSQIVHQINLLKEKNVSQEELEQRLVHDLAATQQRVAYETISRQIFGTQIALLKHLKDGQVKTRHDLQDLYEEHELRALPYVETTFDGWIGFLLDLDLIRAINGAYEITEHGRMYLNFATSIGVNENRVF
jgi:hypothetical protein